MTIVPEHLGIYEPAIDLAAEQSVFDLLILSGKNSVDTALTCVLGETGNVVAAQESN
jgi:hypothetical protein